MTSGGVNLLLGAAMAAIAATVAAQATGPGPAGDAKAGHGVYLRDGCYECHGTSGEGAGYFGPKIAPDPIPFAAFMGQIRRPRAAMPVYTPKVLTDAEIADIYAYLKTVPEAKPWQSHPLLDVK